jgi:hypothetical protein
MAFLFRECDTDVRASLHDVSASLAQLPEGGIEKREHEDITGEADDNKDES